MWGNSMRDGLIFTTIVVFILISPMMTFIGGQKKDSDSKTPLRGPGDPWGIPYGGEDHGGFSEQNLSFELPYLKWSAEVPTGSEAILTGPSLSGDGSAFFTRGGVLFKVDASGDVVWNLTINGTSNEQDILSYPIIAGDSVIMWSSEGKLVSVSFEGEIKWENTVDRIHADGSRFPVYHNGSIYFPGMENLYCFEEDGSRKWIVELPRDERDPREPSFFDNGSFCLISGEGYLTLYNKTGVKVSSYDLGGSLYYNAILPPTIIDDDRILIVEELKSFSSYYLTCYNITGDENWSVNYPEDSIPRFPPVVGCNGSVIIPMGNGFLRSLTSDGHFRWYKNLDGTISTPLVMFSDGTFAAGVDDSLVLFEDDGDIRGQARIANRPNFSGSLAVGPEGDIFCCASTLVRFGTEVDPPPSFTAGRIEEVEFDEDWSWSRLSSDIFELIAGETIDVSLITDSENIHLDHDFGDTFLRIFADENFSGSATGQLRFASEGPDGELGTDDDLISFSDLFNITVRPVNDPPYITTTHLPDMVQNEVYSFKIEADDPDPDESFFTYEVSYPPWLHMRGDILEGIPGQEEVGQGHVNIIVYDTEGYWTMKTLNFNVTDVNDPPYINYQREFDLAEDEPEICYLEGSYSYHLFRDHEDDPLTYEITPGDHLMIRGESDDMSVFELIPEPDWNGVSHIEVTASDGDSTTSATVKVTVNPQYDYLRDVRIVPLGSIDDLDEGTPVSLYADFTDPDGFDPDYYKYEWSSNITNEELGYERTLNTILEPGHHRITLEVTKDIGKGWRYESTNYTEIEIHVSEGGEIGTGYEDKDVKGIWTRVLVVHAILLVLLCLVPLISFGIHKGFRVYRARRVKDFNRTEGVDLQGTGKDDKGMVKDLKGKGVEE